MEEYKGKRIIFTICGKCRHVTPHNPKCMLCTIKKEKKEKKNDKEENIV